MPSPSRKIIALEYFAVCLVFWAAAIWLQRWGGAYQAEFSSHPDESAHYVTGLMIRDYLAGGHFTSPLAYAENYYAHYPKVALGMWPPLFHVIEALWILLFSPARASVLILMALMTAATATSIYYVVRREYPRITAVAAGAFFVFAPLTQASTAAVMVDSLIALLDLWAAISLFRFLEKERTRDAVRFGVFTALTMATKANGLALMLLPLLALAFTGRWRMLRARGLYYAGAIVLVCGVPWTVLSYVLISRSMGGEAVTVAIIAGTAWAYLRVLWGTLGWGLTPFCLIGAAVFWMRRRRGRVDYTLGCASALWLSVWGFHSLIGNGDARYMVAALPPALILAAAGFMAAVRLLPAPAAPAKRALALAAAVVVLFVAFTWRVPHKAYQGFDEAAAFLLSSPAYAGGNFLVISHARGEGAFISEVAMHDSRPGHMVLRSTKVLSSSTWYGTVYHLRYQTANEIRDYLDQAPVDAIALDTRPPQEWPDEAAYRLENKVREALAGDAHWKMTGRFPEKVGETPWIDLYSRIGPQPSGPVRLDLRYTLGKEIVAH